MHADIAAIVETHFNHAEPFRCPGYKWIGAVERTNKKGGGIGFLVKNQLLHRTQVTLSKHPTAEISWLRIQQRDIPLYIGLFYGPQEKEQAQIVQDHLDALQETAINFLRTGAKVILVGDFNAKIAVPPSTEITRNGRMVLSFLANTQLKTINGSQNSTGTWTRSDPNNPLQHSIIDYVLANNQAFPETSIHIDEERLYCLHNKAASSDHNAIIIKTHLYQSSLNPQPPAFTWKIHTDSNWSAFQQSILQSSAISQEAISTNFAQTYTSWQDQVKDAAYRHIGKIQTNKGSPLLPKSRRIRKAKHRLQQLKKNYKKLLKTRPPIDTTQIKVDYWRAHSALRDEINQYEAKRLSSTLHKITNTGGVHSKLFWKLKRTNQQNNTEDLSCLKDHNGKYLFQPHEIKQHIAGYYENLYQPIASDRFDSSWTLATEASVLLYQSNFNHEDDPLNQPISLQEVVNVIKTLPSGKAVGPDDVKYEMLKYGGPQMTANIHTIMAHIFSTETIPETWHSSIMVSLPKAKLDPELMENKRGLTMASVVCKTFERILLHRIGPKIPFTEAQAGARKGRSTIDQIFTLMCILKDRSLSNTPTYVAFLDIHKAYDHIWKAAVLVNLWNRGIRGKIWRIIKLLNENLTSKAKTRFGLTDEFPIMESLRQGGVLAGTEFASLIDALEEDLQRANLNISYYNLKFSTLLLMDDIVLIANSPKQLQDMLNLTEKFACQWHLTFSSTKCKVMTFATSQPCLPHVWTLGPFTLAETTEYKYLGQIISHNLSNSSHIAFLKGKTIALLNTIMNAASGDVLSLMQTTTFLELHDKCMVPAILYNAESWMLTEQDTRQLQSALTSCIKTFLKTPKSTSHLAIQAETAIVPVKFVVDCKQLMFIHKALTSESTPKQIILLQSQYIRSGTWTSRLIHKLSHYGLPNITQIISHSKNEWRKAVNNAIHIKIQEEFAQERLIQLTRASSKTAGILATKSKPLLESYLTKLPRNQAATIFRLRARATTTGADTGQPNKECPRCNHGPDNTQHAFEQCPALSSLRDIYEVANYTDIYTKADDPYLMINYANFAIQAQLITLF